ncbi:MAG TPA: adenylate/guanylate cyclase domain-containing protein [Allosphingosinicella sp.]
MPMPWNHDQAVERIGGLIRSCPQITMEALTDVYPRLVEARRSSGQSNPLAREALISIPRNRAIVVDAVHVYARLSNYDDYRLENGVETEDSHKRALNFLHLHYAAVDRLVQDMGAQRVDFHGGRLHCVVVDPVNNERARVLKALALAFRLIEFTRRASSDIAGGNYTPTLKVGVDTGKCVAINSGTGCEQEPLFLGAPANYAAKLAAGDGQGVFPSNRVRTLFALATFPGLSEERAYPVTRMIFDQLRVQGQISGFDLSEGFADEGGQYERLVEGWRADLRTQRAATGGKSAFVFHAHTPPLNSIDYASLSPGNSIRMPVASIFADLGGYTAYIDRCLAAGRPEAAVRALHVLRGEFHNVLKRDFQSRKVRYIGDCMHGILAFGAPSNVDLARTTVEALKCAGGLYSSFELVQRMLGGIDDLGLAIGVEVGTTPISRIGIRGDRGVRVASSTATIQSQIEQERIVGSGLALGPEAFGHLSFSARRHFPERRQDSFDYDSLAYILAAGAAITSVPAEARAETADEFRPHLTR